MLSSSSFSVINNRGYIAGVRKYSIQWYLSSTTKHEVNTHCMESIETTLTSFRVRKRQDRRQQTRHRRSAQDLAVMEEGVDRDGALAHVHQTLRYPHDEQAVRLLVVVARQLPEHLR